MKKALSFALAIMIAATVLSSALGNINQISGIQYTTSQIQSVQSNKVPSSFEPGAVVPYSLKIEKINYSSRIPKVKSTRIPSSFKQAASMPTSLKLERPEDIAASSRSNKVTDAIASVPVPMAAQTAAPMLAIEGLVFEDKDGNGILDNNETGLAGWTVQLEKPIGVVINSTTTDTDGKFAFKNLSAGDYVVSEIIQDGWSAVSPGDGKITITLTNESIIDLRFSNQA